MRPHNPSGKMFNFLAGEKAGRDAGGEGRMAAVLLSEVLRAKMKLLAACLLGVGSMHRACSGGLGWVSFVPDCRGAACV